MKILVTGGEGFIGRRLIRRLIIEGHDVICHEIYNGDISEKGVFNQYRNVEYVYHLAARTFVPASWDNTFDYFKTNVMGTANILEYCRYHNCGISAMSTYVYGEPKYLPVDEEHTVFSVSPYHESKLLAEELCRFYSNKFNLSITVFRPFNVYGRGQNEAFLLPKILKQVLDPEVKEIEVMDLEPKRDYVYVDDVVEALVCALQRHGNYEVYNIGSGISTSVEDVIKIVMQITGIMKPYYATNTKRIGEISDCIADIKKIKDELNFTPKFSLPNGIEKWFKEECEK